MQRVVLSLFLLCLLVGCGGHSSNQSVSAPTSGGGGTPTGGSGTPPGGTPPSGGGTPTGGGGGSLGGGGSSNPDGQLIVPTVISVAAGQTVTGTNITVPNSASGLNVELLGVNPVGSSRDSASNNGGTIARGSSRTILVFGRGLGTGVNISFSGPSDIKVSNLQSTSATDGKAGLLFDIAVEAGATPGARTVIFTDSRDNLSTFTGGLEIE